MSKRSGLFVDGKVGRQEAYTASSSEYNKYRAKSRVKVKRFIQIFNGTYMAEYQLYRGDSKFPRTKKMTGSEMFSENQTLEDAFYKKALDTKARLMRWRAVDWKQIKYVRSNYISSRLEGLGHDEAFALL